MEIVIVGIILAVYVHFVHMEVQANKKALKEQKRKSEAKAKYLREQFGYRSDSRY